MPLRTYATPLTIGSFIAVSFTGMCMLLGYRSGLVDSVHEISSILFVGGSILHIVINNRQALAHLKRPLGATLIVCFVIVSALAIIPMGNRMDDPRHVLRQVSEVILNSNLQGVATLTRQSEQELMGRLATAGFGTVNPAIPLREIARTNRKNTLEVLAVILP